jgi:hypothetical protein
MKIPTPDQLRKLPNDLERLTFKKRQRYFWQDVRVSRKYLAKEFKKAARLGKNEYVWYGASSCKNLQITETMRFIADELKSNGYAIDNWESNIIKNDYKPCMTITW